MAEVSIKVSVRCRPFVQDAQLGVNLRTIDDENGEVELVNSKYSTTRFPFSYAWWSAYGWQHHLTGPNGQGSPSSEDQAIAEGMTLVDQQMAYNGCGEKIMEDLMHGNAIVLFAYGLSGSGKTFTVFGPDDPAAPEAWYKHAEPHSLWGILPRLAFELFKKKADGWKITMKYFQNVVDTVRDLMSPVAAEKNYKSGMKKDKDGFMDIEWCQSQTLESWEDLRNAFTEANKRKAIAPTQFNHQSTRGHCIMTLEVEMPHPTQKGMKQKGRVYVCDLAGTEPAGDIVYANYKKLVFDDGRIEHKYLGPHQDQSKTKALQDQGKKINLSLSEMAQFFMKMAKAVKAKKLKPGQSLPGCNTYFLCKFLKDTMLQAKTYLFCAIRPEVDFHKYTFATLGFAQNASVIKLAPKKATTNQSAKEMALLEELERMKQALEEAKKNAGGGGGIDESEMNRLLAEKQSQLVQELKGESEREKTKELEMQKQKYMARGISLSVFETDPKVPYLVNVDEDSFRHRRFMYMLGKEKVTVGSSENNDVRPLNMHVVDDHCYFENCGGEVKVVSGKGEVYVNGELKQEGDSTGLKHHDRVVIGQEILCFVDPNNAEQDWEMEVREMMSEFFEAKHKNDAAYQDQAAKLAREKKELLAELEKMKKQGNSEAEIEKKKNDMEMWRGIDATMLRLIPLIKRMEHNCKLVKRDMLSFKLSLQQPKDDKPSVKIQVQNSISNTVVFLDPFELETNLNCLEDQISLLKNSDQYTVSPDDDIVNNLFDTSYQFGTCTNFLLHTALLMETDADDELLDVMKSVIPYNQVGELEVTWKPMSSPENSDAPEEILESTELIGKPWTYKLQIGSLKNLATNVSEAHIEFEFNGEKMITENIKLDKPGREVKFDYEEVIHVDNVDQSFLDYLDEAELKFNILIKPGIDVNETYIGGDDTAKTIKILTEENVRLKEELAKAHARIKQLEGTPSVVQKLQDAKEFDAQVQSN